MSIIRSSKLPVKHPGLVFKEKYLSSNDRAEVAQKLNISTQELVNFVNGESAVSIELGLKLEQLTGISLEFWMNRQKKYNLQVSRISS